MQKNKLLFVSIAEKGHINPLIGIAQHLQRKGYEIAFFSQKDLSSDLEKAGLFVPSYTSPLPLPSEFITKGREFVEKLADPTWLRRWIEILLLDSVPLQIGPIQQAAVDFGASLIVADPMVYAAAIAAHRLTIPWAGVSSSLNPITPDSWTCELTDTLQALSAKRTALLDKEGIPSRCKVSDLISPWLNIVFSVEAYMPRSLCENDFSFYVGNSFPPGPRGDETPFPFHLINPKAKKVYMSMGSQLYDHPDLFSKVAKALDPANVQMIFSLGDLYHSSFPNTLPRSVLATAYAPQLQILEQVDLFITHGGANSVMESLSLGVPTALLPICNDQFLQARFVKRAGTGILLHPLRSYQEQLMPLLETHCSERKKAKEMQGFFQKKGGALEAASLIEKLYLTRKPLRPL